jgi:hypothetical protein
MPTFLAEQFLVFRPGFAIETGSTLFLLIMRDDAFALLLKNK